MASGPSPQTIRTSGRVDIPLIFSVLEEKDFGTPGRSWQFIRMKFAQLLSGSGLAVPSSSGDAAWRDGLGPFCQASSYTARDRRNRTPPWRDALRSSRLSSLEQKTAAPCAGAAAEKDPQCRLWKQRPRSHVDKIGSRQNQLQPSCKRHDLG